MFERLLVRFSPVITGCLAVLAIVGYVLGSRVALKLSLTDLLPDKHPAVLKFNELTEIVGGVGYLAIVLRAEDGESHVNIAPQITEKLRQSPLVRSAFYHREQRFFADRLLYYLTLDQLKELEVNIKRQIRVTRAKIIDLGLWDDDEATAKKKPAFNNELKDQAKKTAKISQYLISDDKKHLLVMVKPSFDSTDLDKTEQLVALSDGILKEVLPPAVTYDYGERYYNKVVETHQIKTDIFVLGTLSICLIAVILFLYLKSFRALVAIFAPVLMGLGITMGLTYLVIGHINIITGFLIGIVSGLGVDYGIHLVLRLRLEFREPSSNHPDPVWRTIQSSGHSVFVGAVSAALAFLFLCFSDFRAFSEFGFVCGVGIIAVFVCLLGSFSTWTRLLKLNRPEANPSQSMGRPARLQFPVLSLPKGLAIGAVVTTALFLLAGKTGFEYDFNKMMQHSKKTTEMFELVDRIYDRSSAPSALATDSRADAEAVEQLIKDKYLKSVVSEYISGATIVPEDQDKKQAILQRIQKEVKPIKDKWIEEGLEVPAQAVRIWLAAKPFTFSEIPPHVQDALRGTKGSGFLLYLYPQIKLNDANGVRVYAKMIRDFEARWPKMATGSDAVIFSDILDLIQGDGFFLLSVIFLSVGVFIFLSERSVPGTLVSYIPLLVSLPVGMGLMWIFGVKFNIFNIAIIPTFVAMGIDVPIHISHRTKEIGSGYKAVRDLAASIQLALMTAAIGFGVLIFARAGVLKSLGWIALLGTIAIWWVGLLVLPACLEWWHRRKATA